MCLLLALVECAVGQGNAAASCSTNAVAVDSHIVRCASLCAHQVLWLWPVCQHGLCACTRVRMRFCHIPACMLDCNLLMGRM